MMEVTQSQVKDGVDNKAFHMQESNMPYNFGENSSPSTVCVENAENSLKEINSSPITTEALPRLENYRTSRRTAKRPSLGELHGQNDNTKVNNFHFLFLLMVAYRYLFNLIIVM